MTQINRLQAALRTHLPWHGARLTFLADGELLILATNRHPKTALADDRLRWGIETLFSALKTRGFNLESTHFCHAERLSKL